MADHPLRPATRLCLGRPLPYQLADGPQTPPQATGHCWSQPLSATGEPVVGLCGISAPFGRLSPSSRADYLRVTHPCATVPELPLLVRLACVRRAANVRSEPGSNSPVIKTVSRSGTKPNLRIDPVTSAVYSDYSKPPGQIPLARPLNKECAERVTPIQFSRAEAVRPVFAGDGELSCFLVTRQELIAFSCAPLRAPRTPWRPEPRWGATI